MKFYVAGSARPAWMWFETLVISIGSVLLAFWINRGDPLFLESQFPWTWLAPVVVALRYGAGPGIGSVVILLACWLSLRQLSLLDTAQFPTMSFLGGFITTLLCAEVASAWHDRLRKLERSSEYGGQRLEELTRKYYLLQLSHEKLYQSLITRPVTLLDSLRRLRELMAETSEDLTSGTRSATGLQAMLNLLSNACRVTNAAVYRVVDAKVQPTAVASVGTVSGFEPDDPLVNFAIEQDSAAHINLEAMEAANPSRYLIAVPLRNCNKEWIALLLVGRMPFMAFTQENLQILLALVSYYADGLIAGRAIAEVRHVYPDCPLDFIDVLARLTHVQQEVGIESSIVVMTLRASERGAEVLEEIRRTRRTLDLEWVREMDCALQRLVLMPMTDDRGVSGFISRTELQLSAHFGERMEQLGVRMRRMRVREQALPTIQAALDAAT